MDPRASLGKFNRNDNLRKSDSKDTKMKQYFKRSYTVHGLSSAARKIRSSFGKGKGTSKQQLDEMPPLNVPKKKSNKPNRRETQNEKFSIRK